MEKKISESLMDKKDLVNISTEETENSNILLYNKEDDTFVISYYIENISTDKNLINIIKKIERMIRTSEEYSRYLAEIRAKTDINNCTFLKDVTDDDATIEFHHYPFTLFEITLCVILKKILNKEKFTTFSLTSDVLKLHAENKIGIVPLTKTLHELAHSGKLFIPIDSVLGNFTQFVEEYKSVFTRYLIEKYNNLIKKTEEESFDFSILDTDVSFIKKENINL